ncbi:hypothetical protein PCANC_25770 [Puccinia coronata f. sp. avenae]|uniref:Uncharacterized protein n=1 Tax=Puccinia coronata f. sp. avenae TaxID=200324 RepID=A0A2N5S9N0_9BASI|nr:hypothetical protein PCANC_25770 [Puccinia coronata f. sp. avenae]PLW37546.1 hypothetical protein PCASD_10283 [Puccinia coronata f. sp. avenae]
MAYLDIEPFAVYERREMTPGVGGKETSSTGYDTMYDTRMASTSKRRNAGRLSTLVQNRGAIRTGVESMVIQRLGTVGEFFAEFRCVREVITFSPKLNDLLQSLRDPMFYTDWVRMMEMAAPIPFRIRLASPSFDDDLRA